MAWIRLTDKQNNHGSNLLVDLKRVMFVRDNGNYSSVILATNAGQSFMQIDVKEPVVQVETLIREAGETIV